MKKKFYSSLTFYGALGWGIVVALEGMGVDWPVLIPIAKGLATLLGVFGIRRAMG